MHLVKFQKFFLPSIGLCQHLEGKEVGIEGERDREIECKILIFQEFSFLGRWLKSVDRIITWYNDDFWCNKIKILISRSNSQDFIVLTVLKIKILRCLPIFHLVGIVQQVVGQVFFKWCRLGNEKCGNKMFCTINYLLLNLVPEFKSPFSP